MTITQQAVMSKEVIYDFLDNHQTAVMSLSGEEGPYAIPITYRFDPETETFYFRLVFPRRSEKREFLPDVPECLLVSYEEDDPVYQSVVARGTPTEIREGDITPEHVAQLREVPETVRVDDDLVEYVVTLARETRVDGRVEVGVSPRGTQRLFEATRAYATIIGREYVTPDDIKRVAHPVLAHRLVLTPDATVNSVDKAQIVDTVLESVPVPTIE